VFNHPSFNLILSVIYKLVDKSTEMFKSILRLRFNMKKNEWWEQALRDLDTAEYLLEGERYKESSLFCQQAVEKALKAVLLGKGGELIKIHDLVKLGELAELDSSFMEDCEKLTGVYIDARYPDTSKEDYTKEESTQDIKSARKIIQWLQKHS
jgi:HEPN domain-containing protein